MGWGSSSTSPSLRAMARSPSLTVQTTVRRQASSCGRGWEPSTSHPTRPRPPRPSPSSRRPRGRRSPTPGGPRRRAGTPMAATPFTQIGSPSSTSSPPTWRRRGTQNTPNSGRPWKGGSPLRRVILYSSVRGSWTTRRVSTSRRRPSVRQ